MIGKIFDKGKGSFRNRIEYIFGLSKHEHAITTIKTIGKNCFSPDPLRNGHSKHQTQAESMIQEFDAIEKMRDSTIDSDRVIKPVWHAMLSLRPGEKLSNDQWLVAVETYLADMGFGEENKWVAVLHGDTDQQHVHIVANRIRMDEEFTVVKDSNERFRNIDSVSGIEDRFGLIKTPLPTQTWGIAISRRAKEASERDGEMPFKNVMVAKIAGAVEATAEAQGDMFMLIRMLRKQKVYVHFTKGKDDQPTGIAYEYAGRVVAGSKLKRARLTFQKLTQKEGISYDPETFHDLEIEAARRDEERQERVRVYYLVLRARNRRPIRLSFQAKKQQEVEATIKLIIAAILALFGIQANWELEDKKESEPYYQLRSNWTSMPKVEQEQDVDYMFNQHALEHAHP